ncbi:MAG: Trk system potassium transporter TrkA, partial [Clostridia bacterium]|nr:Trk system potassium transporter TrkA [Clostridia bacterium]
ISPRKHISNAVLRYVRALENSRGSNVETLYRLMDDRVEALEFNVKEDPRITGIPLRNLKLKKNLLIAGIVRERKSLIPSGSDTILPGDSVVVLTTDSGLRDLSDILA